MRAHIQSIGMVAAGLLMPLASYGETLEDLYRLRSAQTRRVSSADPKWQKGNDDCRSIAPGATLTIAEIKGAGIVRHVWFTIAADDPQYGRSLVLRMYWDGAEEPAVESPIGDFFAVGHGALRQVNSIPVSVGSDGRALNCYWPMPFTKGARITLSNDSKKYKVGCVYWYVDYEATEPAAPRASRRGQEMACFHAQYRQEYPAKMGEDYLILDAEGRGHYVGTVLSAQFRTGGWFGEGDDRFFIDGADEPQLRGTGTEDYFSEAWGFREVLRPFYGVTLWEGYEFANRTTAYRWHINDPVHFTKSLRVTIEHKGQMAGADGKFWTGFEEREDLFSSVAYWYQTGKAKRFAALPPAEERVMQTRVFELETLRDKAKVEPADTNVGPQDGAYSGGKQLFAQFQQAEASLTLPLEVKAAIKGLARLKVTKSWDYGTWKISLDGKPLPGLEKKDLYSLDAQPRDYKLGSIELDEGEHALTFECLGKNPASKGFFLGADALIIDELTPYTAEKPTTQKAEGEKE